MAHAPHVIRLRPAPHCRTRVLSYSLKIQPKQQFLNWQQDPFGNYLARLVLPNPTAELLVEVDLVAEMAVFNPFDFFLEPSAEQFPFIYEPALKQDLKPFLESLPAGPLVKDSPPAAHDRFPGQPQSAALARDEIPDPPRIGSANTPGNAPPALGVLP